MKVNKALKSFTLDKSKTRRIENKENEIEVLIPLFDHMQILGNQYGKTNPDIDRWFKEIYRMRFNKVIEDTKAKFIF